jgi:hypothetical protein
MFNIFSHQENPNQNYTEILSYPSQNGYQANKTQKMLARIWEKRKPYTLLVGMKI